MSDNAFDYLQEMGCKRRGDRYVLDGFSPNFYLCFNCEKGDGPESVGTCDVHVCKIGSSPKDSENHLVIKANCKRHHVMRILSALGIAQFSDSVKKVFYQLTSPIDR